MHIGTPSDSTPSMLYLRSERKPIQFKIDCIRLSRCVHHFFSQVLIGAAAARLVMIDGLETEGKGDGNQNKKRLQSSALWPLILMVATIFARSLGLLQLNDALTRGFIFIPLFTIFLMRLHRNSICKPSSASPLPSLSSNAL